MAYLISLPGLGLAERFQKQLGSPQGSSASWFKCSYSRWKHTQCMPSNTSQWNAFITIVATSTTDWGFRRHGSWCRGFRSSSQRGSVSALVSAFAKRVGCKRYPLRVRTWHFFRRSEVNFTVILRQPWFGFCCG
jgi:hypothetical protein